MLLQIDATFIFVFVSFLVFVFLMNLICYKPLTMLIKKEKGFYIKIKKRLMKQTTKKPKLLKI